MSYRHNFFHCFPPLGERLFQHLFSTRLKAIEDSENWPNFDIKLAALEELKTGDAFLVESNNLTIKHKIASGEL